MARKPHFSSWWALGGLFLLLFVLLVYFNSAGMRVLPPNVPTSLSPRPIGLKALYLLYDRLGFTVHRLAAPWTRLDNRAALLLVQEPFYTNRQPTATEVEALAQWVQKGGIVLYGVAPPQRGYDPKDPLAGDLALVSANNTPSIATVLGADRNAQTVQPNPLLKNVHSIAVQCPLRLQFPPKAPYRVLFRDAQGIVAVQKPLGKGTLVVVADNLLMDNAGISLQDNALFLANLAAWAVGRSDRWVLFDEYHHGYGAANAPDVAEGEDIWRALPAAFRATFLYLVAFALIILYNGNRRIAGPRPLKSETRVASEDYVTAFGRLFRRAGATDFALHKLVEAFLPLLSSPSTGRQRGLQVRVSYTTGQQGNEVDIEELLSKVARQLSVDVEPLRQLLARCNAYLQNKRKLSPEELLAIAKELDQWKRRLELVRF